MEILNNFKENGYFTAELYHLLARKRMVDPSEEIVPSIYEKEMKMITTERLQNLNNIEIDNIVKKGGKPPGNIVLSFTPRIIVFQNFKPNDRIVAKFSIKNISKAPTFLNMVCKESSYMSIKPCGAQLLSRLAPGISATFAITFTPIQYEDYTHRVTFYTDVDQYVLPLIAMGPRPIFGFPDAVVVPRTPLKIENDLLITVHNVGMVSAGFTLNTKCPYTVHPKSAYLAPMQKIEIKVSFKTMRLGESDGILYAVFETGENFRIMLSGTTHMVSLELEKQVIRFLDTYNTMVRQQTFKIVNKSEHLLTYMCMKNENVLYDFEDKLKLATMCYDLKSSESAKYRKLVQYDVLSSHEHERVYTRIFSDEIQALVADESLHFQNTHFSVTPIKGQVWPHKSTELTVTFSPKEIGQFESIAYIDIDGVTDRVPLKMVGTSLPPAIYLNLETLDMDSVYISKTYNYEIVAINKGHINGVIVYKDLPTLFDSRITCTPEMHCLRPGDKQIFIVSFCNSNQGPYFEEINFVIRDTDVVLKLYLKGTVIYPSLMFSIPCLDFGNVSVGVPKTLEFNVINESVVTVKGSVKISSDGPEISSVTLEDCAVAENGKFHFPQWPREFNIEPWNVVIGPESRISLKVTLIANLTRANQTCLELELEKSDSPPIVLPVTYNAMVPRVTPAPDIKLRVCFLDCTYKNEITIYASEYYGYFTIEESQEKSGLKVEVGLKRGLIEPNSSITLPVDITTSTLGVHEYTIRMLLFGVTEPIDICHITACGVRPIVTCTPIALHWGQIKLLTRTQKVLTLCNDSPVYVYYKASLLYRDGRWIISPAEGFIEPEGETDLTLSLCLLDADTYTNKAVIQLEKVKDILVPLSATGVGTSIVVGPLRDNIVLGRHFTKIPLNCKLSVKNCGTRLHSLEWSQFFKPPKAKNIPTSFFSLEPKSFKISSGEQIELTINGLSPKVATVKETWYLIGSVEGINKKELLMECPIVAEFVDPKIEVSSPHLNFQYDFGPYSEHYKLTDILTVKNLSKLPLDIDLKTKPPFSIIQKQGTYKILPEEEETCCCIRYDDSDLNTKHMKQICGPHQSKIFIDFLTLTPVEPLRKGSLHFFEDINKIKMAFNLTHSVEERLEDQEVMKIQILFDTTKHTSLKSKIYSDLMRIKFKGHKNKDSVKLVGKIHYPNILVASPRVDFRSIQNGSLKSKSIKLENVTPLLVCYKFSWKKYTVTATVVPESPKIEYESSNASAVKESADDSMAANEFLEIVPSKPPAISETNILDNEDLVDSQIQDHDDMEEIDAYTQLKKRLVMKTMPMIINMNNNNEFTWTSKLPQLIKYTTYDINEIFQLTPHRGLLKPNDVQLVHVIFKPKNNISVRATLECEVLGGPPEYITVTGQSSALLYRLNTHKLNFKIRSFHEDASEKLILTNIAMLSFEFNTLIVPSVENRLEGIIRDIVPAEKILEPDDEVEIQVIVRPGVVGYFSRIFLLEIGHLPHIPIEAFGWGVMPQVYLSLQRPEVANLPILFGYRAIPTLTLEYLEAVNEIFSKGTSEHLNSPQLDKCFEDPHFQQDWHICSSWDGYPSIMDIDLAIERMLVIDHIRLLPDLPIAYSSGTRTGTIPDFYTTPYLIDYGVVILGSSSYKAARKGLRQPLWEVMFFSDYIHTYWRCLFPIEVQCIADVINYGPITTKFHLSKNSRPPPWLSLKLCGKLNPGEIGKLEVTFSPTAHDFTELEQFVETSFDIEVPYGVTIPLHVKALCAVPYLVSTTSILDFGAVRCGDKIISCIPLKNVGKPTCIWNVTLRLKTTGPNPMTVLDSSGKYEPGEGGWLSVAFKPTMEMAYEGVLLFRFHMNPHRMIIPITGHGVMPRVHIIGPNVNFPPTLPWADTTDLYFGLINPCPFPIELIVCHSDEKWAEEEEVYQLLFRYYNKPDEMLVPTMKPGVGLPHEVMHFYNRFKDAVKKNMEEEAALSRTSSARPSGKKVKSPKNVPKGAAAAREAMTPPKPFRTETEIISDVIKSMKDGGIDPLRECLEFRDPASTEASGDKHLKGLIVFVHGSPAEEVHCQEIAYTLGMKLGLPIVNIDLCLIEALCVCECPAKSIMLSAINELYDFTQSILKEGSGGDEGMEAFEDTEDEFDIIQRKLDFLAKNKGIATPRSKGGDKKKGAQMPGSHTGIKAMGSTTMFQMDLLQTLLTDYFSLQKFTQGFIVDSLTSNVFKNPPLALTTIIKCKNSIWNLHLVLCQGDFSKWAQAFEEKAQHEAEVLEETTSRVYNVTEIEEIIEAIEGMDDEEYENALPEHKSLYIAHGLENRRRKHIESVSEKATNELTHAKEKSTKESKSTIPVAPSESKKRIRKDDAKNKPSPEYVLMSTKYADYYKNVHEHLVQIACNWMVEECELGFPLYTLSGNLVGVTQKKAKKKSEIHLQQSDVDLTNRGFPLTILTCSCLRYKQALANMFNWSPLVQTALEKEEEFDILQCPVNRKEYTVLLPKVMPGLNQEASLNWLFLDESLIKKCECNQIMELNLLDDSTQDNVLNILSKWHCVCGKKVTSTQTSTTDIPSASLQILEGKEIEGENDIFYPLPLRIVKSMPGHSGRLVLEPGDLVRCKFSFNPQVEGNFSVKRFVEVNGWPDSRVDINVNGICDLPRLDSRPKKMFDNFVRKTLEDNVYKITYLDDQKLFEFGPIFIGANRIYEEEYMIDLKNSSLLGAEVEIEFQQDTSVFHIDKNHIELESGCRGKLTIAAAPVEVDVHNSVLLFCIKDNPDIVRINIACIGVVPIVQILPETKMIDYGKHLLYRREEDRFIIKNDCILPIMWKIRNAEEFMEDFIISQTSGIIPRHDNQVVPVAYIACNVGVISNKALIIDIYDELGRGDPMLVDQLLLSAECYDVMVECAHENPSETYLNFGNVKVNSPVSREMYFMNRGKYNIYYKLKKVKNFPEPMLLRSFEAINECGIITPSQKLLTVEFQCTPVTSMNLVNVPAYNCSLMDGSKDQVVVAKFPVCVTIASFYNTFTLFPLGELNFHIIPIGSGVLREVILNNTSKCPFTYEIVLPPEYQTDPIVPTASLKGKDAKIKHPPMRCGSFLIMNEDNLLAPGASRTISIQFMATAARTFEETIHFIISDTCPAEAQGVPLNLVGTGAMPKLDFWNVETTFREHLIVKKLSEYKVPESSPHCVFVEDSVTLHFFCVTVKTSYVGAIDMYNDGLVPCILTLKLHYQPNTNKDIFSLDKYDTHIEPFMHKRLSIMFSPKSLQEYRAVLEIKLKSLQNQEVTFKLCIIGEGVIPRIRLIAPVVRQHKLALLQFPVTCVGSVSAKGISFKNVSSVKCTVNINVLQSPYEVRPVFWINMIDNCDNTILEGSIDQLNTNMKVLLKPSEVGKLEVYFNPIHKGRTNCDIKLTIADNPFEYFTILCEAEAFIEDVLLLGLEMLSMDIDLETYKSSVSGTQNTSASTADSRKKTKSAPVDKKKKESKKSKKVSQASMKQSDTASIEPSELKYILDFGGCEICTSQKRTVVMVNNSEKAYKFTWLMVDNIIIKPSVGYLSPGEEKDIEITFFSAQPVAIKRETLNCSLMAISDDSLTIKSATWDNRQTLTLFDQAREFNVLERYETVLDEQIIPASEDLMGIINIVIIYSVTTEFTRYRSTLPDEISLMDTFIYQTRTIDFTVENVGKVPMKIVWRFHIDDEYPTRIDNYRRKPKQSPTQTKDNTGRAEPDEQPDDNKDASKESMFSGSEGRESVDTWFEVNLPFKIEPEMDCLKPNESRVFNLLFSPLEAFDFKVRLRSSIDNLDPYDQNMSCKIKARSLIPYVHLDIEESDYLTSGRRKVTVAMPRHTTVLEFNVLGSGCYKKEFNVINPTSEAYEFVFGPVIASDKQEKEKDKAKEKEQPKELVPVHCNMLKGFVEGGTSTEVAFTFSPTAPGVYESHWKFMISAHSLVMDLLVVGIVREPDVLFVPTILIIKHSLVGFTTTNEVILKNIENQSLTFEFKGNSLCNESGKTPIIVEPEEGVLKPSSETSIKIKYTPIQDGPLSFKIFCKIQHLTKFKTLCVNALSHSISPSVIYNLMDNDHVLNNEAITNIYLDKTASTYERTIPFTIKNDGSATFFFDWHYTSSPVKKYLQINVDPKSGHVAPGNEVKCTLYFTLKEVPVQAYPITLSISDGPEYNIFLHAEIEKPCYHFSCKEMDFGKCIVNAPDVTYKKSLGFTNDDKNPIVVNLDFVNLPEMFVDYQQEHIIEPNRRLKIPIFFRPNEVKQYDLKLPFWVNSLCQEIITIKGEGVPLLVDVYEGCQKSFDLGPVKVGDKTIRQIEVMNHSKVQINASFIFKDLYCLEPQEEDATSEGTSICLDPTSLNTQLTDAGPSRVKSVKQYKNKKVNKQVEMDVKNALSSLKVVPQKCVIKPHQKVTLKIHFKPVGLISSLNVQLNCKVLHFIRPLVHLNGSATGMSLRLSQNSIQFGRVRKRGCRVMKVVLQNEGDFGARFWWQPIISVEFKITPMYGVIAARTNVTFTITFRPLNHNPFIKVWASCNIENYMPLELAMYATCVDVGAMHTKTLYLQCPVREVVTEYIIVTNPTDDTWLVLSELEGGPFETLREFNVDPNSTFEIPVHFRPKTMGKHERQVLYSPLGESALFVTLVAAATYPNPNGNIKVTVSAKTMHTEILSVHNITEFSEWYVVSSEVVKIEPSNFDGYYEIKNPERFKVWGEAKATCCWTFICFEQCEMHIKVMFINEDTREYQYYNIMVTVTPSEIIDRLTFVSRARESVLSEIVVRNPLAQDANFRVYSDKLDCPEELRISRNSQATLVMVYSPLVVGESEEYLMVTNELVGTYLYTVTLKCLPAKEKELEFTTPLGTSISIRLRVENRTEERAEFTSSVSHSSIMMGKEYALGPYEKGKFLLLFEPTELGVNDCRVAFNSPSAGEFVFNIKGTATDPKPQGPYAIKAGGSTTIKFKNVFDDTRTFKIYVDRDDFYVKTLYEPVKSKKDMKVVVYLSDQQSRSWAPAEMPTGCLTIECYDPPEPRAQWTYFLQGI